MKIGERFTHDIYGKKLVYEVDSINNDGTFNSHLVMDAEPTVTPTETPVKAVEEPKTEDSATEPEKTSTRASSTTTKRTYNRRTTTKK